MTFVFVRSVRQGSEDRGRLYLRVRNRQSNLNRKFLLGLTLTCEEWDRFRSGRYPVRARLSCLGMTYGELSRLLNQLRYALEGMTDPARIRSYISRFMMQAIAPGNRIDPPSRQPLLTEWFTRYIDELQQGVRTRQRRSVKVADGYVRNLRSALAAIRRFEKHVGRVYALDEVDMEMQRQLVHYLRQSGMRPNTIRTRLGSIRTLMNVAWSPMPMLPASHSRPS